MKVTVERSQFLKALGHVHRVVEKRNTIPILSNVLMNAGVMGLKLKATDLDIEVVETIQADVGVQGAITVPAHVIYDIVRKLPEGAQVSLETTGETGQMVLRSGRSRFTLQTLPESDFPDITAGEMPHVFSLPAGDFKRLIDKTQFAVSTEETRYYLNGIYFHTLEIEGGMPGVIVPRKAVAEIQKLLEGAIGDVEVQLSATKIKVSIGDVVLTSKLIDGTFPDYGRVIPSGNDKRLTVNRAEFAVSVDRVSTISSERGRAVKLSMADGRMTLAVTNPDSGSATEEIEVDYDASPLDIGFNARYLLDITAQLDSDTALFRLADPGSPTVIQDREGASALYVLMPMRV